MYRKNVIMLTVYAFFSFCALWIGTPHVSSQPLETSLYLRHYTVRANDTLGELTSSYLGSIQFISILQHINHIKNPDNIRAGMTLMIPVSPRYIVEPFLPPHELSFVPQKWEDIQTTLWGTGLTPHNVSGNLVGIPITNQRGATQFIVVQIDGTTRERVFYSTEYEYAYGDYGLSADDSWSWTFLDLDGDGDTDILGEHEEGADIYLTVYVFHWESSQYRQYLLIDGIPLGFVHDYRSQTGSLIFDIRVRCEECPCYEAAEKIVIDWNDIYQKGSVNK
jgi:hypothetical protein